jgi:hypothetical protein
MRIAIPQLPSPTPPAPVRLDRAAIAQVAAVAAAMPWTALDALVADRAASGRAGASPVPGPIPVPVPVQGPLPSGSLPLSTGAAQRAGLVPGLGAPLPAGASPTPVSGLPIAVASAAPVPLPALAGLPSMAMSLAAGPDRLSLSTVAATPRLAMAPGTQGSTGDWLRGVLAALTGDDGAVSLGSFGLPPGREPSVVAAPGSRNPQDLLQLLLRGTAVGSDQRAVEVTLGLTVQRQAQAGVLLDAALLDAVHGALEQLASREVDLDFPGAVASLAGQSLRFQASFDPLALWPMQSFLLSGLLIFGRARPLAEDELEVGDGEDETETEPQPVDDGAEREARQSPDQPPKKPKRRRAALDAPTPLPADGGAPIISAGHWLELELRHWRVQVRRWMALPPGDVGLDAA